jgi:hypothetical protein
MVGNTLPHCDIAAIDSIVFGFLRRQFGRLRIDFSHLAAIAAGATLINIFLSPDLSRPDLSWPDFSLPDLSRPNLSSPDFSSPDLSMPDLLSPDLLRPDLSRPDVL